MKRCHACGKEVVPPDPVGRKAECPHCRAELRCCLNCVHHEPAAYNQCRESQADRVMEKDRANFCEYFRFREGAPRSASKPPAPARDQLDSLFRKE
jgi:hypothetical protein